MKIGRRLLHAATVIVFGLFLCVLAPPVAFGEVIPFEEMMFEYRCGSSILCSEEDLILEDTSACTGWKSWERLPIGIDVTKCGFESLYRWRSRTWAIQFF